MIDQYAVRKAYKRKALETHPDKLNPDAKEDERMRAETQFRKVCLLDDFNFDSMCACPSGE
jgi:DnaJ-class molecular chaperone